MPGGDGPDFEKLKGLAAADVQKKLAHQQSNAGAAMIFVTLAETQRDGTPWDEEAENKQAGMFTSLLRTGSIAVQGYRIGSRRLLLSTMKGWYGQDVVDFLIERPEVMKATWDSVDYENPNVPQNDVPDFDDKPKAAPKKRRRKKRRKKEL